MPCTFLWTFAFHRWDEIFTRDDSSDKPQLCGTNSKVDTFPITKILTCASLKVTVIFSIYPHNLCHFLCKPQLDKWSILSITPVSTWFLLLSFIFTRVRSGWKANAGAAESSVSSLDWFQKVFPVLVGDILLTILQKHSNSQNLKILSLFYRYSHGKSSHELHFIVLPVLNFTVKTSHVRHIALARGNLHSSCFYPQTSSQSNQLPRAHYHDQYNVNIRNK